MTERTWVRRITVLVLVAVAASSWYATSVSAKSRRRCDVAAFVLPDGGQTFAETLPDDNYIMAEWTSEGSTTLTCRKRTIPITVREHAYDVQIRTGAGDDKVNIDGTISYQVTGDFDGDGTDSVLNLEGRISGDGVDQDDVVTLSFTGRGSGADRSRIKLHHEGRLDLRGDEWRDLGVDGIVVLPLGL